MSSRDFIFNVGVLFFFAGSSIFSYTTFSNKEYNNRIIEKTNIIHNIKIKNEESYLTADYGIADKTYNKSLALKRNVRSDLVKMIKKHNNYHKWSKKDINSMVGVLTYSHNRYKIDYRLLLSIFALESSFNPKAIGSRNRDGTRDYGLGQHNSCCLRGRVSRAIRSDEFFLAAGRKPENRWDDPITSAIATIFYLIDTRDILNKYGKRKKIFIPYSKWIISYNSGINGTVRNIRNHRYNIRYYNKVMDKMNTL